jgi:glycosyltransferase involved in cell wall biosynthesis
VRAVKIVHVLAPAQAGGLERVVHALAIGQQRAGHAVLAVPIVDRWIDDHSFAAPLARAGVEIQPLVVPPRAYLRERAMLRDLLDRAAPDVLHSHGYHTDVVDGGVARRAGIATVSTAHGFTGGPWRNRVYEAIARVALRRFDAVVAVSRPLAEDLQRSGVARDRIHMVPNAWSRIATPLGRAEARHVLGLDPSRFTVGWVGRMTHEKGLDVFVDAMAALTDLPLAACAVGEGPERAAQEARGLRAGLGDRIRWTGLVREAGRYFRAFDLLVLSSRTEGVPMVLLEAAAEGVPVVATAVGGIPDVVSSNEAILIAPERPDALAAAVRDVFNGPADAVRRADAARQRVGREFAEPAWLARYADVYAAAAGNVSGRLGIESRTRHR